MTSPLEFDALVRAVRPQLVRYVTRLVGEADAEDVVQLVLSNAAAALAGFRGEASPRTWLFRIATNASHDWNRARRGVAREPLELVEETAELGAGTGEPSQERRLLREEMSQCVGEVLRRLPESYQVVLALSDCEDLSDREVAAVLGATLGATKIRLHRARTKMKEELEGACSFYRDGENTLCCDRKENSTPGAYPSDGEARLQDGRRTSGGSDTQKETSVMSPVEPLPLKQRHLIGVGAAIAAGCQPCTTSYVAAAQAEGACERGVRFAIEQGLGGRASATNGMADFAAAAFAQPELDAAFRDERALLGALIGVAAAVASNAAASLQQRLEAARALGATDGQLRTAVRLAEGAKRGAENAVMAVLSSALGDAVEGEPTSSPCCAGQANEGATTNPSSATRSAPSTTGAAQPCACGDKAEAEFETVRIEKTKGGCSLCDDYAKAHSDKPVVVMSCEGACLRGEISRQAANLLCHELAPEKTVRLCLGGAFTKDAGQRALVRHAGKVVALEGCATRCASRMMRGHLPELSPEVIVTDALCDFDRALFGIDELPAEATRELGRTVATKVVSRL